MYKKCALLLTTCDGYSDAWYPFFRLLEINWENCPLPIYLNTETKDFTYKDFEITTLHPNNIDISWSKRLKQALEKIEADYILFMLEDFFIKQPVRSDMVQECIDWMELDHSVVFIDFYHDRTENNEIFHGEFSEIEHKNDWAINANCALWRKTFLMDILRDENPWDFEMNATARWRRTNYKIFTHRKEFPPIFDYQFETVNGAWSGIIKGKWLSAVPELFDRFGIEVDFSTRGLIVPPYNLARKREKNWFWHDMQRALTNPKMAMHYLTCTVNVGKDKAKRFWRKYFNR